MRRTRLGLCIGDREYGDRFTSCLMNHYRDQLELHMFSQKEALQENWKTLDAIVLSDDLAGENRIECEIPQIYLFDGNENVDKEVEKGVVFVDKYQEVNKIVDEILKQIGEEIKNASGGVKQKLQVLAVYSLAENEMQLPFAVTLSSILSENEKVLLLDLQENSGLSQLMGEFYSSGMEELLVMAESGKYSKSRMVSCIGDTGGVLGRQGGDGAHGEDAVHGHGFEVGLNAGAAAGIAARDGKCSFHGFAPLSQVKKFVQHSNSIFAICNSTLLLLH